jgi:hypothetical protein
MYTITADSISVEELKEIKSITSFDLFEGTTFINLRDAQLLANWASAIAPRADIIIVEHH